VSNVSDSGSPAFPKSRLYHFEPDAARARFLDQRMRSELGESLDYLAAQLAPHVSLASGELSDLLGRIRQGPVPPLAFALYADLVYLIDQDDLTRAELLLHQLLKLPSHRGGLLTKELGDRHTDEEADRYIRYVDTDPDYPIELTSPSAESIRHGKARVQEALDLADAVDPELGSEIRELIREIVLCGGSPAGKYTFDGASSFMLWGAILINADRREDELTMLQMLAHESAHNLLFGLSPNEVLLNNGRDERYSSPLRDDPRPLEGIYHATFVSARMHRAARALAASALLTDLQQAQARRAAEKNAAAFAQGLETLDRHADLSAPGRAIMEGARAYMLPFLKERSVC
jgi:hypothetical protein